MSLEFDDDAPEPRDYTKWVWIGVIVLFVALMGILYMYTGLSPQQSQARVRHILVSFNANDPGERGTALAKIKEIRDRVLKGEDFGSLAEEYSNDPGSASKGGDLGYVKRGEMTTEIDAYVWTAPIGQLSDVIQTKFGFHIVVVDDRRLSQVDELKLKQEAEWRARMRGETGEPTEGETPPQQAPAQP